MSCATSRDVPCLERALLKPISCLVFYSIVHFNIRLSTSLNFRVKDDFNSDNNCLLRSTCLLKEKLLSQSFDRSLCLLKLSITIYFRHQRLQEKTIYDQIDEFLDSPEQEFGIRRRGENSAYIKYHKSP